MMFLKFDSRCYDLERLDTDDYTPDEYALWQREMRWINRFLGDTRALRLALKGELHKLNGHSISILDVGAGSGELLKSADKLLKHNAFLVGAELNASAARLLGPRGVQCDGLRLPFADASFDFVISSLFAHHVRDREVITLIAEMARVARVRFFLIDLHRHALAYYLYKTLGPLVLQRFTVEDGALSIRRSFRPDELRTLAQKAGIENITIKRRAAFRLVLSGNKS